MGGPCMDASDPSAVNNLSGQVRGLVVQAGSVDKIDQHYYQALVGNETTRLVFGIVPPRAGAFQHREMAWELTGAAVDGTAVLTGAESRIVSGLGGVGKTQLAADHARTLWSRGQLDLLMWVTATSRDAIVSAYDRAFAVVGDSASTSADGAAVRWLEWLAATGKRWLVVLDDLQDPADIVGLWPPHTPTGRVVVTTRRRDASLNSDGRRTVEVGLFTPEESVAFLTQRLARRPAQAEGAAELARELGHLPVVLAQAAAYIVDRTALTCSAYLRRWADRRRSLASVLPGSGELPDEHREPAATTWSLSIDLANSLQPVGVARPLLEMLSLLDANGIPDVVVTAAAVPAHLTQVVGRDIDAEAAADALSCLHRLSLVTHNPDTPRRAVRVHALVQRAVREALDSDRRAAVARAAADALDEVWPEIERDSDQAAVLRSNAAALHSRTDFLLWQEEIHPVLMRLGDSMAVAGQLRAAIDHFERLSTTAEQRLGRDHPDVLDARSEHAHYRGRAGDAAGAAAAFGRLLADYERILGPDRLDTFVIRNALAFWRGSAGDVAGALPAFEQLLVDCEQVLAPDHPLTLVVRSNLARHRGRAGDVAGSVAAFEQLLADRERIFGPDHPATLNVRTNLAQLQGRAGDAVGAVAAFERLLVDQERVLGPTSRDCFYVRINLADMRGRAGDVAGAAAAFDELLRDCERVLGPDHPYTLDAREGLELWTRDLGEGRT